ncbi:MAG: redoxin domain-containing protein [Anaerolineales bacterium]|nr:redoxin domain-containing protein [Anaerolineales bacterium]
MSRSRHRKTTVKKSPPLALILAGVGLLALAGIALIWTASDSPAETSESAALGGQESAIPREVDFPAPAVALQDVQGQPAALADYAGQVVLVNHWATWCPPCKAEMPVLQEYYHDYHQQGFTIVAIEAGEPLNEVSAYVQKAGLTFPVWVDPQQSGMRAFQVFSLPTSFVIDRQGQARLAWTGAISRAMLEEYVTPLLVQ